MELCSPCGEVPWSIAAVSHRVLAPSRAMTRTVSVLNVWVFRMRAKRFTASWNANSAKNSVSKPSALGSRFFRGSYLFFPVALRRLLRPSMNSRPVAQMWSSRRWRASRRDRWMLHTGGGWGYSPPYNVKLFECLEKRYINVTNYLINFSSRLTNADFYQPRGFCGAGLYCDSGDRGHASLSPLAILNAFVEVPPPPSNQTM